MTRKFILEHYKALGDTFILAALIRDLKARYGREIEIDVRTGWREAWQGNPNLTPLSTHDKSVKVLWNFTYAPQLNALKQGTWRKHFLTAMFDEFTKRTGVQCSLLKPKPDAHLFSTENRIVEGDYWIILSGGRVDGDAKHWVYDRWPQVIDPLRKAGLRFVQVGSGSIKNHHPPLDNVIDLRGKTTIPQLLSVVHHCKGVICPVTSIMHLAAWADKPCVVIAGGREHPSWEHYVNGDTFGPDCAPVAVPHRYLHTMGQLPCCPESKGGCWNWLMDKNPKRPTVGVCSRPIQIGAQKVPECMTMIRPEQIVEAALSYYQDGVIDKPLPAKATPARGRLSGFEDPQPVAPAPMPVEEPKLAEVIETFTPIVAKADITSVASPNSDREFLDDPVIGGKFTVFVLCYGDHLELAKRCLDSIVRTSPRGRIDLRIALNAPTDRVRQYVQQLDHPKLIYDRTTKKPHKYTAMREMFHDPKNPIQTKYLIWFDDDSHVVRSDWLARLAEHIIPNHHAGARMFGHLYYHPLRKVGNPKGWFEHAPWFRREKGFQNLQRTFVPNGDKIWFPAGAWWALNVDTMRLADVPDARLLHNGGDVTIGLQVQHSGGVLSQFDKSHHFVKKGDAHRRGQYEEVLPWYRQGKPLRFANAQS